MKQRTKKEQIIFFLLATILLIYIAGVVFFTFYTMPNTYVNDINYSLKPKQTLTDRNRENFSIRIIGKDNKELKIAKDDINFQIEIPDDIRIEQNTFLWPLSFFTDRTYEIHFETMYDREKLQKILAKSDLYKNITKPKNSEIIRNKEGRFVIKPEVLGNEINTYRLQKTLEQAFIEQRNVVYLDVEYNRPDETQSSFRMQRLVREMNRLKEVEIVLSMNDRKYILKGDQLLAMVKIEDGKITSDTKKARDYLKQIAQETDRYESSMEFTATNGRTYQLSNKDYGWQMNITATTQKLTKSIQKVQSDEITPIYAKRADDYYMYPELKQYLEINREENMAYYYEDHALIFSTKIETISDHIIEGMYRIKKPVDFVDIYGVRQAELQEEFKLYEQSEDREIKKTNRYIILESLEREDLFSYFEKDMAVVILPNPKKIK